MASVDERSGGRSEETDEAISSREMRLASLLVVSLLAACGSAGVAPVANDHALVVTSPRVVEAGEKLPRIDEVRELESLVPASASLVIGMPAGGGALDFLSGAAGELVLRLVADRSRIAPDAIRLVFESSAGWVLFRGRDDEVGAVVRVRDGGVAEELAWRLELSQTSSDTWRSASMSARRAATAGVSMHLDRFAKAGVFVVTTGDGLRASVLARANGQGDPFVRRTARELTAAGQPTNEADASEIWAAVDLAVLRDDADVMAPGSRLDASLTHGGLSIDFLQKGQNVPRIGRVVAPAAPTALGRLPDGAFAGVGLSIRRSSGTTLQDVLVELDRGSNRGLLEVASKLADDYAHRSLAAVDDALGDEVALGLYASEGASDAFAAMTLVATIDTRNERVAKELVMGFQRARGRSGGAHRGDDRGVEIVAEKGRVIVVMGPTETVRKLLAEARKPSRTLAAKAFGAEPAAPVHAHGFVDLAAITSLLPDSDRPAPAPAGSPSIRSGSLVFGQTDDGIEAIFRSTDRDDAGRGIRVLAALASSGVRQYIDQSKIAEAKNTVGAIARSAIGAYEREQVFSPGAPLPSPSAIVHVLCDSATPVPAQVPKGTKVQPSSAPGADFQSGTPTAGWRCLRFEMTAPHHYQYEYRRGGPYKGPARGGPDPGPFGFEISAEGDLDGDGKTSLFTRIGTIDRPNAAVRLSTEIFVSDERE